MSDPSPFTLTILTHGRRYTEPYETLDDALQAAAALLDEPRESAESIEDASGTLRLAGDELAEALAALVREGGD